jgi:riboflavin kinase/FMN adenylyltransferase
VGERPTFDGEGLTIETFLLEPLGEPNPEAMRLEFRRRLRAERKFPSAAELKEQILADVARARAYWRRVNRWARPDFGR